MSLFLGDRSVHR